MHRSISFLALGALALGLLAGAGIAAGAPDWLKAAAREFEAVGALWLNALRMTIVPLVFALIVLGVATVADAGAAGRLAARALMLFALLLAGACAYGVLAAETLIALWPTPRAQAAAFVASLGPVETPPPPPRFGNWLAALAPANPVQAAAETAILPLVVFALFVGFAATRLDYALRTPFLAFFVALREIMVTIVRWVLMASPIGVFALALGVGARAGLGAAGVLAHYAAIVSIATAGVALLAQVLASTLGGAGFARFAVAAAPAQVVAVTTQSSLASLPIMVARARDALGVPERVTDLVLPLAVALFRLTSPVANLAVAFYAAHLWGVTPAAGAIFAAAVVALGVSIASVGLPGQVSFMASTTPICIALGAPVAALPLMLAVEIIPDIFRTLGNVTGDLAATTLLRRDRAASSASPPPPP